MDEKYTLIKFLDSAGPSESDSSGAGALPAVSHALREVLIDGSLVSGSRSLIKKGFKSVDQVSEFSMKVEELVQSKDFLEHLSIKVGEPRLGESENDFVARAKEEMKYLLRMKLDKSS